MRQKRIGHSTTYILQAVKYNVCSGGDLIGDLMTKLAMRRKGISGTAEVQKQPFQLPSVEFTALLFVPSLWFFLFKLIF